MKTIVRPLTGSILTLLGQGVAADRYYKAIHERDASRSWSAYEKSAAGGAAIGALTHAKGLRGRAALIGAGVGTLAQGAVRGLTGLTKDQYGDRSFTGKSLDKVVPTAGLIGAGVLAAKRLHVFSEAKAATPHELAMIAHRLNQFSAGSIISKARKYEGLIAGGALTAGIGLADEATSAAMPEKGETREQAAKKGLSRGLVYGGVLAGTEPLIAKGLRAAASVRLGSKVRMVLLDDRADRLPPRRPRHHSDDEARGDAGKFKDSLRGYIESAPKRDGEVIGATDSPVLRNVQRRAEKAVKYGNRASGLAKDAVGAFRGEEKVDSRGRPVKREWEKSWFKNGVKTVGTGALLLGGAAILKHNPVARQKVYGMMGGLQSGATNALKKGLNKASRWTPNIDQFLSRRVSALLLADRTARANLLAARLRATELDYTAGDWDVRDGRGRSARVYAPGSRMRQRREKRWGEKVGNIRRVALIGGVAALAGGLGLGYKLGKFRASKLAAAGTLGLAGAGAGAAFGPNGKTPPPDIAPDGERPGSSGPSPLPPRFPRR